MSPERWKRACAGGSQGRSAGLCGPFPALPQRKPRARPKPRTTKDSCGIGYCADSVQFGSPYVTRLWGNTPLRPTTPGYTV